MKTLLFSFLSLAFMLPMLADHHIENAEVGKPAPAFTLKDHKGNTHNLSDYAGKVVVLEWVNFDCPFVKKHYNSGNMPKLQNTYTTKDVIWLSINSSAEGRQGCFTNDEIAKRIDDTKAKMSAYLIDKDGKVGMTYGAKTTPNMYIIDTEGKLVYAGAIDDNPSPDPSVISNSKNYIQENLDLILSGGTITTKTTKPYGCSVKYASK